MDLAGPNRMLASWLKPSWLAKILVAPAPDGLDKPCWLWLGGKSPDGYGLLRIQGKMQYLHRYSWAQANGQPLGPDRDGHHLCYRRNCFQDAHIAAASADENRGPTRYKAVCPVSDEDLVALYDLGAWYQNRAYVLDMDAGPRFA